MKILYIITQADDGGAQKYVLTLAQYFNGAIASGSEASMLFEKAKTTGLTTHSLKHLKRDIHPWHDFWVTWEIRQLLKKLKPDIVHLNSSKAGIVGSFAAIGLKTKVVYTAHGFIFNEPLSFWLKSFYLALEKVASNFRDLIITVSEADRTSALKNRLIDKNKIITIHNGIPLINFLSQEKARWDLNLPAHKFLFVTVANFYITKGLDILIRAVAYLDENIKSQSQFIIIGDGRERKVYEQSIQDKVLRDYFILLGSINEASKYLKAFDAFILPSRKEGFPYTILEALQAGLPIITTNTGGTSEAIGDAGILIPANNPKLLAESIKQIIEDKQLKKILAQKALERAGIFTEEKMFVKTAKIYEQILGS